MCVSAGAVANPKKPFVAIVGGSKVSTKITVVESLMSKAQKIIIGGGMIFTFFKARGLNVSCWAPDARTHSHLWWHIFAGNGPHMHSLLLLPSKIRSHCHGSEETPI